MNPSRTPASVKFLGETLASLEGGGVGILQAEAASKVPPDQHVLIRVGDVILLRSSES